MPFHIDFCGIVDFTEMVGRMSLLNRALALLPKGEEKQHQHAGNNQCADNLDKGKTGIAFHGRLTMLTKVPEGIPWGMEMPLGYKVPLLFSPISREFPIFCRIRYGSSFSVSP